jgi:hypothetical protein
MTALPCPPQHWGRFSTLLDRAMDLPEPDRAAWLGGLAGEDAALRPWLARVLGSAAGITTGDFLSGPRLSDLPEDFAPNDTIGPYRLEARLGAGGMGQVWRASRADDGPVREVALKLPHAELLAGPVRARFRRERDVLAGLAHPNIAALYDAGVSEAGHPYLALELVAGEPITACCIAARAPLARRVELLRQMLAALGYAHARLIVHRDIKPSNVLVTQDGQVKLLDFGIAKLLDSTGPAEGPPLTQPLARLATPGYAAPEQMEGGRITVAADLFAAGVLLFELCTGRRPNLVRPSLGRPDGESAPLASSCADAALANLPEGASLRRALRGDLDAIIARALCIDPAGRYGSADAFARDLRRWQDGMPVSARRIGRLALAGKFVRRNRLAVGLTALLAVALAGGIGGVAWQARRAERQAARALAIKDFMIGLFEQGDAASSGRRLDTMTARTLLDLGADRAPAAFAADPETEIELLATLANIYDWADEGERAQQLWQRRLDLATGLYGPADARVIEGALRLANSEVMFLHDDEARALLDRIRGPVFARTGPASLSRARWLAAHAHALRAAHGAREQALAEAQAAVAIYVAHFPEGPEIHDAMADVEGYLYDSERYADSLAAVEQMRAMDVARHEFNAGDDLVYHVEAGARLERLGRRSEAAADYVWAQDQAARQFGEQSLWFIHVLTDRAQMADLMGDRAQAAVLFAQAMGQRQDRAAVTGQSTGLRRAYGAALAREGRAAEAIPILEQVLRETLLHGHDEQNLRRTRVLLGDAYDQAGRTADARAVLESARADWLAYGPAGGTGALGARERWARFLAAHGEGASARAEFTAVVAAAHGQPMAASALAQAGLARLALAAGAVGEADAASQSALRTLADVTLEYDVRAWVWVRLARAECLAATGRAPEARALAQGALADALAWDAPQSGQVAAARALVARIG